MFLAPVYAPRELMTGWARAAAGVNPITLLLETGRGLLADQAAHLALCLGALVVAIAALTAWALRGLSRAQVASA